ncbi:MAG TPA: N-acetylornithine carbamoyltransferase [Candidatus Polarisedimenticolaceae bacterium]
MLRHFLAGDDWSDREVVSLLDEAIALKAAPRTRAVCDGKILAAVFFDPSLRTRTSMEVAMAREGGRCVVLEPGRGSWPIETRRGVVMDGENVEHLIDAARVLGRYADALAVRSFPKEATWAEARQDAVLHGFAEHAGVPVINLESARRHPCQGLADAMTIRERLGRDAREKKFVLMWAWHPKPLPVAVPNSAALAGAVLGMNVTIAHPPGYNLDPEDLAAVGEVASRNGGRVEVTHDLDAAVEGADVVYAKSWGALSAFGDREAEATLRSGKRSWIADERRMGATRGGNGIFLHCLPVRRGVEASHGVLDGPWSAVVDEAENRLHAQRALLRRILGENA